MKLGSGRSDGIPYFLRSMTEHVDQASLCRFVDQKSGLDSRITEKKRLMKVLPRAGHYKSLTGLKTLFKRLLTFIKAPSLKTTNQILIRRKDSTQR
jgi:hypothetical protein